MSNMFSPGCCCANPEPPLECHEAFGTARSASLWTCPIAQALNPICLAPFVLPDDPPSSALSVQLGSGYVAAGGLPECEGLNDGPFRSTWVSGIECPFISHQWANNPALPGEPTVQVFYGCGDVNACAGTNRIRATIPADSYSVACDLRCEWAWNSEDNLSPYCSNDLPSVDTCHGTFKFCICCIVGGFPICTGCFNCLGGGRQNCLVAAASVEVE